jgi:hypothetical protein
LIDLMDITDPAAAYEALRASTAEMLKLDPANLSLVEGLQLDLIALLRLTTSDMQGAALSGEAVDLDRLSTALGMLQKLVPEKSLVASAPAPETRFGPDHRARLREMIERVVLREDEGAAAALADACEREERMMQAEALGLPPEGVSEGAAAPPVAPPMCPKGEGRGSSSWAGHACDAASAVYG